MAERFLTVAELERKLSELSAAGYGDMRIKCGEEFLHDDEISYSFLDGAVRLRGRLFNQPFSDKVKQFEDDVKLAIDKFYGINQF